jgi:hypothetical protein
VGEEGIDGKPARRWRSDPWRGRAEYECDLGRHGRAQGPPLTGFRCPRGKQGLGGDAGEAREAAKKGFHVVGRREPAIESQR